jgi:hypothetical protein
MDCSVGRPRILQLTRKLQKNVSVQSRIGEACGAPAMMPRRRAATAGKKFPKFWVSLLLMVPAFGLFIAAIAVGGINGLLIGFALFVLYLLTLSVMMSAVQGIFNAVLYRYACFKQVPAAFDADLIKSAWTVKN